MNPLVQTYAVLLLMFSFSISKPSPFLSSHNLAKPGCSSQCGELIVPYPFGIGTNCSLDDKFTIYCNTFANPPRASFKQNDSTWIKLISDSTVRTSNVVVTKCEDNIHMIRKTYMNSINTPLTFSTQNMITLIGCMHYAWPFLVTSSRQTVIGCMTYCSNSEEVASGECLGAGCCQTPLSKDTKLIAIYTGPIPNITETGKIKPFSPCTNVFIGDPKEFKFNGVGDITDNDSLKQRITDRVSIIFNWAIGDLRCTEFKKNHAFACLANSSCVNSTSSGYRCNCDKGYEGNPYLSPGCQDVNECEHSESYPCYGKCFNTIGSYTCTCSQGSIGDAHKVNGCQHIPHSNTSLKIYIIIVLVLVIVALVCGVASYYVMKRRKLDGLREKFFQANGGVLLKQKMNSQGCHEAMTLFTQQQLIKATNNYSQKHIIGRGSYGVVYKGVLSDKRVVAIKKSKLVDAAQVEQFINEVWILTQVIHRFVVKLLGCCLEEEVPVLVYEYIPNNTLFHHIHHTPSGMGWLSWDHRLRIATEVASALAYLHSETIMPIIHRDIKSSNILLDANYTAKVSDFGASRLVPLDHEHVTTLIQGTLGYLDPEYFHTSQLTQKSDVYSFGVVLAELITNKKHIGVDRENNEKNLATYFVNSIKENRLNTIVDPRIWNEGSLEQLLQIGDLVKRCLNLEGRDRPIMKEVLVELHVLRKLTRCDKTRSQVIEVEQHDNL